MKHKLSVLPVLFALLALVFVFTACGADENVSTEGVIKPRTITIYSIKGEGTTDSAIQSVQAALNKITEPTYNTHVVLKFYYEDEYEAALKAAIDANQNGDVGVDISTEENVTEVTIVNDYGRPITVYPEAVENQLDIFLIPEGSDKFDYYATTYLDYVEDGETISLGGVVLDLSSELAAGGSGELLTQYIPSKVLDFCRENPADSASSLYGVPSNRYYGDAEYLLINKELFEAYNYDPSIITDMYSIQDFLVDLAADCGSGKLSDVIPLYNTPSMNLVSLTGKNSVVATTVSNTASPTSGMFTPINIFQVPAVRDAMNFINAINVAGGIMPRVTTNVDFSQKFGAAFVYGNASLVEQYADEYYVVLNRSSLVETEDIYKGVFAVSSYASEYADRCVEILTCLNTNKEFRNILGYGVENEHYIIDEATGFVIEKQTEGNVYKMDLEASGNMFLLYQNSDMTEEELVLSNNNWAVAKETNNSAVVSPYTKFELSTKYTAGDYSNLTVYVPPALAAVELEMLYDEIWIWVSEFPTYIDHETGEPLNSFSEYILVLKKQLDENIYVSSAVSQSYNSSIQMQYKNWYSTVYGGAE